MRSINGFINTGKEGVKRLRIKPGRGRINILPEKANVEKVREMVKQSRKRIGLVKAPHEIPSGKQFSERTLVHCSKTRLLV
jgi:hypothetical protein